MEVDIDTQLASPNSFVIVKIEQFKSSIVREVPVSTHHADSSALVS